MPDAHLVRKAPDTWINHHGNVKVPVKTRWTILNASSKSTMAGMKETAARIQGLIGDAVTKGVRLRASGSRWSFSEIAAAEDGWALMTDNLDMQFTVAPASLDPAYKGTAEELLLVQCGRSIASINQIIETPERQRSLRTSGASNGQTIAGALGTGTHGSAVDIGALESQVAGIQLLTANRNLWVERPSDPVLNAGFAAKLGAEPVRDESLFQAALVSLGALGIVHSVLIRTTGRYLLRSWLKKMKTADVASAMHKLKFAGLPLPDPTRRPYFFQVVVDPADPDTAYVTTRYKEPCPPDYVPDTALKSGIEPGNDLPGLVGKLLDIAPALRPALASVLIKSQLSPFSDRLRAPSETYTFTSAKSGVAGSATAVPIALVSQALEHARLAFENNPGAPLICACRFAQKSPALLGFTRFDPTCIMDLDGVDNKATRRIMEETRERFDSAGIPYAQHWGKIHGLTKARVRASYGSNVDRWNDVRKALMPSAAERNTFSSALLDKIGLNG